MVHLRQDHESDIPTETFPHYRPKLGRVAPAFFAYLLRLPSPRLRLYLNFPDFQLSPPNVRHNHALRSRLARNMLGGRIYREATQGNKVSHPHSKGQDFLSNHIPRC